MRDFKKLQIWSQSHALTLDIYQATAAFPDDERYGLRSQMRRASSSIPTNIAEGSGRGSVGELRRYLSIAFGSASELTYLLLLAKDLTLIDERSFDQFTDKCTSIMKMIRAYRAKLGASS